MHFVLPSRSFRSAQVGAEKLERLSSPHSLNPETDKATAGMSS